MQQRNVAIFVYDGVEILDFGGPGEVFQATSINGQNAFKVFTVAASPNPIMSQRFVKITPEYTFSQCPKPDIVVLPGGSTGDSQKNGLVIQWIQEISKSAEVIMSVCTGAMLLSKAKLLDGLHATTWYGAIERLREMTPKATVHSQTRFVDNGQIITTAGVSAGIDGALHVVERLLGREVAAGTAQYMEYDKWNPGQGLVTGASKKSQK
jgi:transcriptional regulator GlxA family with amidase domain